MKEFKIVVERIVRPIRGSGWRTMKMREELMGHLMTSYDEAVEQGEDDPVAYAVERLGDPDALREELQDSVPRSEKFEGGRFVTKFFELTQALFEPSDESSFRLAFQAIGYFVVLCLTTLVPLALLAFIGANVVFKGSVAWLASLYLLGIMLMIVVCCGMSFFICTYLFRKFGLHKTVHVSSSVPSIVKGGIGTLLGMIAVGLFLTTFLAIEEQWPLNRVHIILAELFVILVKEPVFYLIVGAYMAATTYAVHRERRHHDEWGSLNIDE